MIAIRKILRSLILNSKIVFNSNKYKVNPIYITELKNEINLLSNNGSYSPSWLIMINQFKNNILNEDMQKFLSWNIVKNTITAQNSTMVDREYSELKKDINFNQIWKALLIENSFGGAEIFWKNPKYGVNKIHQTYHLMQFCNYANIKYDKLSAVLEFGGGYGNMCQLFSRLNPNGKYFIFDLPEMLALQKFYLNSQQINSNYYNQENNYCQLYNKLDNLETNLMDINGKKMFIGTWSFSESPTELRYQFNLILKKFDYFLIAFQENFDNISNSVFFQEWILHFDEINWEQKEIKYFKKNYYLFGTRKIND